MSLHDKFKMKVHEKEIQGEKLTFYPLTTSQRLFIHGSVTKSEWNITEVQATAIAMSCEQFTEDDIDDLILWEPDVLNELMLFLNSISGTSENAQEDAEKNSSSSPV